MSFTDMTSATGRSIGFRGDLLGLSVLAMLLGGCSTLPTSGPTAHEIVKRAHDDKATLRFSIVDLDSAAIDGLNRQQDAQQAAAVSLGSLSEAPAKAITLGPGDTLNVSIYEVGVGLFASARPAAPDVFDPSAHGEKFPDLIIGEDGTIHLPYVGTVMAGGQTPAQLENEINRRLANKSQNPQAIVTVAKNVTSSVFVMGDANKPGRYDISYGREHLLDAIAGASGAAQSAEDTLVLVDRGGRLVAQRLGNITPGSRDDIMLEPADRIQLIKRPRSLTVFGATTKVAQIPFETGAVTLAEAMARVGGPSDAFADPRSIFIFRYSGSIDQPGGKPVIYRLNLLQPASYFLAQKFAMQDKDVVYIANAASNQPSKLIGLLNQLFSPFVTARAISH